MDLFQVFGLVIIVLAIFGIVYKRITNTDLKKKKKHLKREEERRRRSIAAINSRSSSDNQLVDYGDYKMNFWEIISAITVVFLIILLVGELFYDNLIISLLLGLLALFAPKVRKNQLKEKRKNILSLQFKEAAASLSSSLAAGQSIENAFRDALKDLKLLYPNEDTYIIKEFSIINRRVENGESIERAFDDFAKRSDLEDIKNFSDVFITCKRSGGNLVDVIKRTVDIINEKIEIQQDIKVLVSQKKFESRIIAVMPLGMIAFLKYTSGDFVRPLYEFGTPGPIVMTVVLGCTILSMVISQKLMKIEM